MLQEMHCPQRELRAGRASWAGESWATRTESRSWDAGCSSVSRLGITVDDLLEV